MSGSGIVVGTDGSAESLYAVEWAARDAWLRGVGLRIVGVPELWHYHEPHGRSASGSGIVATGYSELTATELVVNAAAQRASDLVPGLPVETSSPAGSAAHQLIASAAGADLLVVGSRGSGGFAGLVLGSLSRYVATHAPLPVVVTRREPAAPGRESTRAPEISSRATAVRHESAGREVVVGIHRERQSDAAVRFGFAEAAIRGTSLLAIEAVRAGISELADMDNDVLTATAGQLNADLARHQLDYPGVSFRVDVVRGHPGRVLATASAGANLVVLGRHDRHGGSVGQAIHAVLGHASCPVAVVPGG